MSGIPQDGFLVSKWSNHTIVRDIIKNYVLKRQQKSMCAEVHLVYLEIYLETY